MGVGGDREHSKRAGNLVKISHFNSQARGQGSLREAIHSVYSYRSHKKQVKEAIPTQSQNWLFPAIALVTVPGNRGLGMTS